MQEMLASGCKGPRTEASPARGTTPSCERQAAQHVRIGLSQHELPTAARVKADQQPIAGALTASYVLGALRFVSLRWYVDP